MEQTIFLNTNRNVINNETIETSKICRIILYTYLQTYIEKICENLGEWEIHIMECVCLPVWGRMERGVKEELRRDYTGNLETFYYFLFKFQYWAHRHLLYHSLYMTELL